MALRGKKPILEEKRFKALIYANHGVGKTHFCCSIPGAYILDTEGMAQYEKFVGMVSKNDGAVVTVVDFEDMIKEVKELSSTKHDYKTLIIDSISKPYISFCFNEAERLSKKNIQGDSEGTAFGKNTAKPKRHIAHLADLLERLDMNIIVCSHEKTKFEGGIEIGKEYDIPDKMGYMLGAIIRLFRMGDTIKGKVEKTRYNEFKTNDTIDFNFKEISDRLGGNIFYNDSKPQELATTEQLAHLNRLFGSLKLDEDYIEKVLNKYKAHSLEEITSDVAQKWIEKLLKDLI